jgi:hypothetical protein
VTFGGHIFSGQPFGGQQDQAETSIVFGTGSAAGTSTATAVGASTRAAAGSANCAVTAAGVGRALPYGDAAGAVTASARGAGIASAAASAAITATASGVGGALPNAPPLPITIDVKLRVEVGLPIVIDVWAAKTATLPISLGRYAVTPTLPITLDVWVAKAPTLPITIYGDLSDSADDALVIWRPKVVLDGTTISGLLIQAQDTEFEEDASPIASLSFVPAAGAVNPLAWVGKTIALWWQRLVNNVVTAEILVYTGTVSDPEWDAVNRVLAISATGDLQAKLDKMDKPSILATIGGTFSEYIFGDPDDMSGWDFAQALMSTQASTLWQDQSAAIRVTACAAKASADYTWTEDDLLEGTPVVRYAGRQDISNTIYLSLGYRYAALRQRNVTFNFRPYQLETPSTFLSGNLGGWELPQRSQIESAANGGGWVVIGSINYSDVWPNGLYSSYSDGGTPILEGLSLTPEVAADLCIGARWTAARRWKQSWTEQYALTVQASDSVAAVGTLATDESYAIEDPADDEEWESNEEFTGYKAGSTTMPNGLDRVYRLDTIRADVTAAQSVALAKAQAEILKSHRRTTVEVTLPFQPQLSLADTVAIDTTYLECKGKVRRIRHHWDIETGDCTTEVSIALSRHNGSGLVSGDALTPPSEPGDPDETEPDTYHNLLMHIGGQDNLPVWDEDWDGYIVNVPYNSSYGVNTLLGSWARNPANPGTKGRIYEEGFHIVAPTIDSEYADPLDFTDAAIYDVAVPEDPLVLISG